MSERYDPQEELEKFQSDLPPTEELPGDQSLSAFPLSTHEGITRAWSYINNPQNADKYEQFEVEAFKQRVQEAARQQGVDLGNA